MTKRRFLNHLAFTFMPLMLVPSVAQAEPREYCPDRPGIGTPACTMAPGEASLEIGLGDWTLARTHEEREDVFVLGDGLLRYGVADHAEVQVGWTALGFARTRDRVTGEVRHRSGTGDVTLALRRNLAHPDGSGLSIAVMPFVALPVGREPIGAPAFWCRCPTRFPMSGALPPPPSSMLPWTVTEAAGTSLSSKWWVPPPNCPTP